jgi:hypothetical protein
VPEHLAKVGVRFESRRPFRVSRPIARESHGCSPFVVRQWSVSRKAPRSRSPHRVDDSRLASSYNLT